MIALVDYGAGNLRSVELALEHVGVTHRRADTPEGLNGTRGIVLPGVGAAGSAMEELEARGLADPLRRTRRPLLGVCLGFQLLTESSAEGDGDPVRGLGRIPGRTRRFRPGVRLPQVGWNLVRLRDDPLFEGLGDEVHFYFLHSYRVECGEEHVTASARYGDIFPAAARRGRVTGVQFHPEKSGPAGLRVLENFCRSCGVAGRR